MRIWAVPILAVCAALGCAGGSIQAQERQSPGQSVVHVAIQVRELSGAPVAGLRPSNFRLSSSGRPLAFQMKGAAAGPPKCVLIVVAPGVSADIGAYLSGGVPAKLPSSYSFSAMGPDGAYVGPVAKLDDLVDGFHSSQTAFKGYQQAIDELAQCRGARSIVYATAKPANPPLNLVRAAERAGALIYDVGGDPRQNFTDSGGPGTTAPPTSVGAFPLQTATVRGAEAWESSPSLSVRTVYVERSLRSAFREMERVSQGWYEVTLALPQKTATIEMREMIPGQSQTSAVDWADGAEAAPTLILGR